MAANTLLVDMSEVTAPTLDALLYFVDNSVASPVDRKGQYVKTMGAAVNAQTGTTYTVLTTDFRKLVTFSNGSAVAVTLPQASATFPANWYFFAQNRGAGTVTVTPTTSTVDGAATLALATNEGALIVSDGTNYFTMRGKVASVGTGSLADDSVTNAKLAEMAANTFKSNLTGSSANPVDNTVADVQAALANARINAQTGTTYTLQATDNGKVVTCSNGSAITVTVPSGLGAGFNVMVVQLGAGQVTFSPSSTTVNNRQSHTKIAGQYGTASLVAYASDTFALGGDTAA